MDFKSIYLFMYLFYFLNGLKNFELFKPICLTRTYLAYILEVLIKWVFLTPCRFCGESYQDEEISFSYFAKKNQQVFVQEKPNVKKCDSGNVLIGLDNYCWLFRL